MRIDEIIKTKSLYFLLTLVAVIILSVSSSYAFVNNTDSILNNGLEVTYRNNKKTSMMIEKTINVKNTEDFTKKFNIYVSSLDNEDTISLDKVMYSINEGVESYLKDNNNGIIYSGILNKDEQMKVKVKFWVSYDLLDNSDQGKKLSIDLNVQ